MQVARGRIVPLGYGKYFRAESIVGIEPIEEGRGPGRRTLVYVENRAEPVVASRSEVGILRSMAEPESFPAGTVEQRQLLIDLLDTFEGLDPLVRSILRDQAGLNLDRLRDRIREALELAEGEED